MLPGKRAKEVPGGKIRSEISLREDQHDVPSMAYCLFTVSQVEAAFLHRTVHVWTWPYPKVARPVGQSPRALPNRFG